MSAAFVFPLTLIVTAVSSSVLKHTTADNGLIKYTFVLTNGFSTV